MSKIAVIISGEYRKFDITRAKMKFLDDPTIDVYVSTWDKTIYSSKKINLRHEEYVTQEKILNDLGRPATIIISKSESFVEPKYNSRMINRWLAGFNAVKNSKVDYDYVVILRTDLFYAEPKVISELEKYKDALGLVWASSLHLSKLPDVFFISSYSIIDKLFANLSVKIWAEDNEADWHKWWFKYVTGILPVVDAPEYSGFIFCRFWVQQNNTFEEVVDIQTDWRDLRLLQECDDVGEEIGRVWPPNVLPDAQAKWASGYFDKYKQL